jgi:predicted N-acyltransferase
MPKFKKGDHVRCIHDQNNSGGPKRGDTGVVDEDYNKYPNVIWETLGAHREYISEDSIEHYNLEESKDTKPQMGLRPKQIWLLERSDEILGAMKRYIEDEKDIPRNWADEYIQLHEEIKKM